MITKQCSKCSEVKTVESFGLRKDSIDGRSKVCKKCSNARTKLYRSGANADSIAETREQKEKQLLLLSKGMRECNVCKTVLSTDYFYTSADGRIRQQCKLCTSKASHTRNRLKKAEISENKRRYYHENKEDIKRKRKEYYKANHEKVIECNKSWRNANKEYDRARSKERTLSLRIATPKWLTSKQKAEIASMYDKSKQLSMSTGIIHTVDHIIPITSSKVSGLHVPWNLQILTLSDNSKKGNNYDPKQGVAHTCLY